MGRRPPARVTASLLGSSHLGQLFTSTAPSLDPFLVKIKNLGSKTQSHSPSCHLQWVAQDWTKCLAPTPNIATPTWTPALSLTRAVRFQKTEGQRHKRNNLIKVEGKNEKRKKEEGERRWASGQKLPSGRVVKWNPDYLTLTLTEESIANKRSSRMCSTRCYLKSDHSACLAH